MRKQIVTIALAGGLGLTGAVLVGPGVAAAQSASPSPSATSALTDRIAAVSEALQGLVSGGTLTQQQADTVAEALAESDALRGHGPGGPGGHGGHGPGGGRLSLDAAAEVLGVTEDELRTQLEAGKSLAQVAEAEGVSRAALVDALVAAAEEHLAEEVAEGDLTQAEADARAAEVEARVEEKVDRVGLGRHGRRGASTEGSTATPSASSSTGA